MRNGQMEEMKLVARVLLIILAVGWTAVAGAQLPETIDLNFNEEDTLIYGATANDNLTTGGALAVGDLNGDGIDDLILGAFNAAGPSDGRTFAGEAYIIFGGSGLNSTSTIDLNNSDEDVTIYGATANDLLTNDGALTVGDVNGDGINDLILGAWPADGPSDGRNDAGEAYIIFGGSGLNSTSTIDLLSSGEDVTIYGATAGDLLTSGGALAVGDVNGDGIDDLILGAMFATGPSDGRSRAGEAYIIFGGSGLNSTDTIDLNSSGEDVTVYGATANDQLTRDSAPAVGDVNGDGIDDLILGAWNAFGPSDARSQAGEAYIIFGGSVLNSTSTIDLNNSDEDVTIYGATATDFLTGDGAMAVGDVNGDGIDDLILGAWVADGPSEGRSGAGEAYIIFGGPGLNSTSTIDLNSSGENVTIYGATRSDLLTRGGALAVGDVNGDGIDDLLLGARLADGPSEGRSDAGEAYIIFGGSGLNSTSTIDLNSSGEDVTIYGATGGDFMGGDFLTDGGALAAGDVNGDGIDDLILGARGAAGPSDGRSFAGEAYIILGSGAFDAATVKQTNHAGDPLPEDYGTARVRIDYSSGDGVSLTTATLTRNNTGVGLPILADVADVRWEITTDRTSFSADLTFHYLDSEITGLDESTLGVFAAPALAGPYTQLSATLNTAQNLAAITG